MKKTSEKCGKSQGVNTITVEESDEIHSDLDFLDDVPDLVDVRREKEKAELEAER